MTAALDLHGLRVALEGDPALLAAAGPVLGGFPPALPGAPDLALALRAGPPAPRPAGEPAFFHGVITCHADGGDLLLSDGHSLARVVAGGRRVEAQVAPASLADAHLFAHVFVLVALVLAVRWRGLYHLHAGALVTPDGRGLLVVGGAGAGKSTATVALLEQGCAYLGDDAVFLRERAGQVEVLAFPRAFHLGPRTAAAFPRLAPYLDEGPAEDGKRHLDAGRAWPGRARAAMAAPALLLLPEVTGLAATACQPAPAAEALGALLESSALLVVEALPGAAAQLDLLRRLVDGARALRVRLGQDLLRDDAVAADWLNT